MGFHKCAIRKVQPWLVKIIGVAFVDLTFLIGKLQKSEARLGFFQTLSLEAILDFLVFQKVDPFVQGIPGNVVEGVDLDQVILRE